MKKVLLIVCLVALVSLVAVGAYASDSSWLIGVKAVSASFGGGAAAFVGVGTTAETVQGWPTAVGSTATAEKTGTDTAYHARHDVARDLLAPEEYSWNLKVGARADYAPETINICLWNNKNTSLGAGGELNHALAYAFYKGDTLLAWFSDASTEVQFTGYKAEMLVGLWNNTSVLIKDSGGFSPSAGTPGFYIVDTASKGAGFADLANYRLDAFAFVEPAETPEPGSLVALGSGLIGLVGFAVRRRKA